MNNNTKARLLQLRKSTPSYFQHKPRLSRKPKVGASTRKKIKNDDFWAIEL